MDGPFTFISYSRADSGFATKLATDLRKAGINIWFDQFDIPAGSRWDNEIQKALQSAATVLVILSPSSAASNNVLDEVDYAIDHNKRLIPVMLAECTVPIRLGRFQYVDFIDDYDKGFNRLVQELGEKRKPEDYHSPKSYIPPEKSFLPSKRKSTAIWLLIAGIILLIAIVFAVKPWATDRQEQETSQTQGIERPDQQKASSTQTLSVTYSPSKIVAPEYSLQVNILKASAEKLNDKMILSITVKAVSEAPYGYAIGTGQFRVKIGEDKFAPDNFYSEAIAGHSFKTFEMIFSFPANVNQFEVLQFSGENLLGSISMQVK
jgi:TIR domain